MHYTYVHTRNDTGKVFYIGLGSTPTRHKSKQRSEYWKRVVAKAGGFQSEIVAYWETREEAASHEMLLISCFKDMGYSIANMSIGGECGAFGVKRSDATKAKLSAALKNVPKPKGWKHSEETKQKISIAHKGKPKDPVAVAKSAAAHKGIVNVKVLEKLWELNRGKKRSQETIDKMKAAWVIRKAKREFV